MKNLKNFARLLLAMVMLVCMTTTAFAATVSFPEDDILANHTFTAYQIFSGRQEGTVLSDIEWGTGIDRVAFLAALKADDSYGDKFTDCDSAADVAEVLGAVNPDQNALALAVAKIAEDHVTGSGTVLTSGENTLAAGYYLVVDTTDTVLPGSAYNAALLEVVGDIEFEVKTDAPSVEKKVLEDDKYAQNGGYGKGYNDVADYTMGETVPFRLIGAVPDMEHYDTYKYIFHDILSAGLTLDADSIKVYGASAKDAATKDMTEIPSTYWTKNTQVKDESFTVSFTDLKTVPGIANYAYIIVEYSATLNQDAEVGLPGNPNTVYLEYSNKPDQSGAGDNETGKTPVDKVIVFTYELDTTKIDGASEDPDNPKKLAGARFVLYRSEGETKLYAQVNAAGKVIGWDEATTDGETVTYPAGSTLTSDGNGLFKVVGLDDGTYYLKEIAAPTGYNMITEPIEVVIDADTANGQSWTSGEPGSALIDLDVTADNEAGTGNTGTGIAAITVVNNSGAILPETGGIGTTIFYALGAALMLGAGVLLVTKKRMSE